MGDNSHYLGPLIVTPGEREAFRDETTRDYIKEYIIDDGQQRITTCLLMVWSLERRFRNIGEGDNQHAIEIRSFLTYRYQGTHLRIRNQNPDLDQFLRHFILNEPAPQTRTSAMSALEEVANYFEHFVSGLHFDQLIDFTLRLIAQAKFILVDLGTEDIDRYLAFDSINSRGLPLTEFDKIKNFCALISKRRSNLNIAPELNWYQSLVTLEKFGVSSRLHESTYIADAYSIYFNRKTGPDEVHEKFVARFEMLLQLDNQDLETALASFVDFWRPFAEAYGFVVSERRDTVDPDKATPGARTWLTHLDHLGFQGICRPLLCAALLRCSKPEFERVSQWAEIYTFRVHAIGGKRTDTNKVGINELAHNLYSAQISLHRTSEVLCFWLNQHCSFREMLRKLSDGEPKYHYDRLMKGWEHCYYFLYQYELSVSPAPSNPIPWLRSREQRKATIEHILPQAHRDGAWWEEHWPDGLEADSFRHRIGNLVLTDGNERMGNSPFPNKLNASPPSYSYNHLNATNSEKRIRSYTDGQNWQRREILLREADMVRFAADRWTFGCCGDNTVFEFPKEHLEFLEGNARSIVVASNPCIEAADPAANAVIDGILGAQASADDEDDVANAGGEFQQI